MPQGAERLITICRAGLSLQSKISVTIQESTTLNSVLLVTLTWCICRITPKGVGHLQHGLTRVYLKKEEETKAVVIATSVTQPTRQMTVVSDREMEVYAFVANNHVP